MPKPNQPNALRCPECAQGKCDNCTTQALDDDDQWLACGCTCGGGLLAWPQVHR